MFSWYVWGGYIFRSEGICVMYLPISSWVASLILWQCYYYPSASNHEKDKMKTIRYLTVVAQWRIYASMTWAIFATDIRSARSHYLDQCRVWLNLWLRNFNERSLQKNECENVISICIKHNKLRSVSIFLGMSCSMITENERSSMWQLCHHCWHRRL